MVLEVEAFLPLEGVIFFDSASIPTVRTPSNVKMSKFGSEKFEILQKHARILTVPGDNTFDLGSTSAYHMSASS